MRARSVLDLVFALRGNRVSESSPPRALSQKASLARAQAQSDGMFLDIASIPNGLLLACTTSE